MDREEFERFKRRGRRHIPHGAYEKIGLQRMAFELRHLEEAKLTQAEKETIAAAEAERALKSPDVQDSIHNQLMREYYGDLRRDLLELREDDWEDDYHYP